MNHGERTRIRERQHVNTDAPPQGWIPSRQHRDAVHIPLRYNEQSSRQTMHGQTRWGFARPLPPDVRPSDPNHIRNIGNADLQRHTRTMSRSPSQDRAGHHRDSGDDAYRQQYYNPRNGTRTLPYNTARGGYQHLPQRHPKKSTHKSKKEKKKEKKRQKQNRARPQHQNTNAVWDCREAQLQRQQDFAERECIRNASAVQQQRTQDDSPDEEGIALMAFVDPVMIISRISPQARRHAMRDLQGQQLHDDQDANQEHNLPTENDDYAQGESDVPHLLTDAVREADGHSLQEPQRRSGLTNAYPVVSEPQRRVASGPLVDPVVE